MNQIVIGETFGKIRFGVPEDLDPTHRPWAFYELLGVNRNASPDEIRSAYRAKAQRLHPDKGGDAEAFDRLENVVNTLMDDGGALGPEHSLRHRYDAISGLEEYFSGFIERYGQRTRKLSEVLLMLMETERQRAEVKNKMGDALPRYEELNAQAAQATSMEEATRIAKQIKELEYQAMGLPEEVKEINLEVRRRADEQRQESNRQLVNSYPTSAPRYRSKILDVVYLGQGQVTFGTSQSNFRLGLIGNEISDQVLTLFLGGENYIVGFPQVHFKAEQANVTIRDPHLKGIVHVVNGDITVDYGASSYGAVIRARAPEVRMVEGFVQRGDLYAPASFAHGEWWNTKPDIDIAVREGKISLRLRSPEIAGRSTYLTTGTLEYLLYGMYNKDIYEKKISLKENDPYNRRIIPEKYSKK